MSDVKGGVVFFFFCRIVAVRVVWQSSAATFTGNGTQEPEGCNYVYKANGLSFCKMNSRQPEMGR